MTSPSRCSRNTCTVVCELSATVYCIQTIPRSRILLSGITCTHLWNTCVDVPATLHSSHWSQHTQNAQTSISTLVSRHHRERHACLICHWTLHQKSTAHELFCTQCCSLKTGRVGGRCLLHWPCRQLRHPLLISRVFGCSCTVPAASKACLTL